jgi:hypothetical protein
MNYKCNELDHSGNPFFICLLVKQSPVYLLDTKTSYLNSSRRNQLIVSVIIFPACQMIRCMLSDEIIVVNMELGCNFFFHTLILKASILYCDHYHTVSL